MDHGNDSMLDAFLFETDDLLERLDGILISCEKNKNLDTDSVNEIFRIMHTIKGSSAMMRLDSITEVAHKVEDLFACVRDTGIGGADLEDLFDLMFRSGDFLKAEAEKVRNNQPLSTNIGTFEQEINDFLKKISPPAGAAAAEAGKETSGGAVLTPGAEGEADARRAGILEAKGRAGYPAAVAVSFDGDAQMENLRAFMLTNNLRDAGVDFSFYPEDIETNSKTAAEIRKDGFLLFFRNREDMRKAVRVIESFTYTKNYTVIKGENSSAPRAEAVPAGPAALPGGRRPAAPARQSLINVNLAKLDTLMDLMGEIVITESMVTSMPEVRHSGIDNNFTKATRQLRKLTDELQEVVMSIRMVPISTVFQKMNRIVRDMSKKLDRPAKLVLVGEDTEVDKTIVDCISDPIMHLVRNAMDHGIESREEREKASKPPVGTITLSAQNTGGEILVSVADDGGGIDCRRVLGKAKKRGLLKKPEAEYTEKEIYQFLLMPGFSTNDVVTEYSGRGVGMDVVKENVEKIGGDVSVDSAPGKGTKIVFKIPLTLAIVNGMKVSVGGTVFTVPIKNIRQSFKSREGDIMYDTNMREIIMVRNRYYPLIRLHQFYRIPTAVTKIDDGIVMMVETHDLCFCVFADALLGEQQVVVKSLPVYLNQFAVRKSGIDGCAILGDGSISLILNPQNLYSGG